MYVLHALARGLSLLCNVQPSQQRTQLLPGCVSPCVTARNVVAAAAGAAAAATGGGGYCCAVLCCAVLCCAMLCCAVLCCAGPHTHWPAGPAGAWPASGSASDGPAAKQHQQLLDCHRHPTHGKLCCILRCILLPGASLSTGQARRTALVEPCTPLRRVLMRYTTSTECRTRHRTWLPPSCCQCVLDHPFSTGNTQRPKLQPQLPAARAGATTGAATAAPAAADCYCCIWIGVSPSAPRT
jgi:hypothetical protein